MRTTKAVHRATLRIEAEAGRTPTAWIEVPIRGGWLAAVRVGPDRRGRIVAQEIRVMPHERPVRTRVRTPAPDAEPATSGDWTAPYRTRRRAAPSTRRGGVWTGSGAAVPSGGLSTARLREIRVAGLLCGLDA